MGFRWITLLCWMLVAIGILGLHFFSFGILGAIAYEGWRVILNGLFQREVIANTSASGLGSGTWALVLYLGLFLPWGLPLGYILTTWLPRARMQRFLAPFRHRITWILLIELVWTLAVVWFFSESVHEINQRNRWID
ncbi:MAG: hypothetical protein ACFB14_04455 [Leptolyngbyaceae cyanobacterium]